LNPGWLPISRFRAGKESLPPEGTSCREFSYRIRRAVREGEGELDLLVSPLNLALVASARQNTPARTHTTAQDRSAPARSTRTSPTTRTPHTAPYSPLPLPDLRRLRHCGDGHGVHTA
jgi:hypothetical protein